MREFRCRAAVVAPVFALALVSMLAGVACRKEEPEPPQPVWQVEVLSVDAPAGMREPLLSWCHGNSPDCAGLRAGESVPEGALVKTERGARASLRLSRSTSIDMLAGARVAMGGAGERAVEVSDGSILLHVEPESAAADGSSAVEEPISVRVAGAVAKAIPGAPVTAVLRTLAGGAAVVTVRRGGLAVRAEGGEPVELRAGEAAKIAPGQAPDKGAAWSGGDVLAASLEPDEMMEERGASSTARGVGTITARVPGTRDVVGGVRLVAHKVSVVVRDGFARTEIEEEFYNETSRVLEGRYVFPLPPDASISRLALWVGSELMEGEIVERKRAAAIFQGIVDDTVRPRDPALLEWVSGGEFSLKIFPIPAKGSRKVLLAYNQALPAAGGRVHYVYPLSLGADRSTSIDDFSIAFVATDSRGELGNVATRGYPASIRTQDRAVSVRYDATSFSPSADFVVSYSREGLDGAEVAAYATRPGEFQGAAAAPPGKGESAREEGVQDPPGGSFVAVRMTAELPAGAPPPSHIRRDVALVVDTSHSQSKETLEATAKLAHGLLEQMDPDERFVVLACDSACSSYPEAGLAAAATTEVAAAGRWLTQVTAGGSSDVAGALLDAARRLTPDGSAQVVYIGDGALSAGELNASGVAARIRPVLEARKVDLRLLGAGRTVDEVSLLGIAQAVGAAYERVTADVSLSDRALQIAMGLRMPVIRGVSVELPGFMSDVYPKALPNLRLGQEVRLVGRAAGARGAGEIALRGEMGGAKYEVRKSVAMDTEAEGLERKNPLVPRLWAEAKIADLEASAGGKDAIQEIIELSKGFHVMSRHTALLVLENERMYSAFGIRRTTRRAGDQSDHGFAAPSPEPARAETTASLAQDRDKAEEADRGSMWGPGTGDSLGAGGLGLSGTGNGGGGRGEGSIGPGSVGSVGHGSGTSSSGQGFGSGYGRFGGSQGSAVPQVRAGATTVSGRLPPEVIQRIVRQNFGRFRRCYEQGLQTRPDLQGRVATRFVIGRDGGVAAVTNGGSDLPDANVVACVVRAFYGLTFPAPEGGIVTVVYPIVFSPASASSAARGQAFAGPQRAMGGLSGKWGPSAVHSVETAAWASRGEAALRDLREDAGKSPESRSRTEALLRGLLLRGRFQEAMDRAARFASMDPDRPQAQELLAHAAAANGDGERALRAIDSVAEVSPKRAAAHARAARAFEAAGDERRACAHWRSLAELTATSDEALYESLRCRARVLDGAEAVLRDAQSLQSPGALVAKLMTELEAGNLPRFGAPSAGSASSGAFEVSVRCESGAGTCPTALVIAPDGSVYSPWTPPPARGGSSALSLTAVRDGTYRTLLVGGEPGAQGKLELRALGVVRRLPIVHEGARTVVATMVSGLTTRFR